MAINTVQTFSRGGRELVDLLSHCVLSINTDTLFLYLVREYQLHPQATCAIALHDVFCGVQAPARISDPTLIPPKDLRLHNTIAELRAAVEAVASFQARDQAGTERKTGNEDDDGQVSPNHRDADDDTEPPAPTIPLPPRYLFDSVANQLASVSSKLTNLESSYDPNLSPLENLPGGELNAGQRAFVDNVWTPLIRPYLVRSGFWRIATIG